MLDLPLHPAIVHLPLGLAFIMPLVAIAVAWAVWKKRLPRAAWLGVLALQVVLVGAGLVAMQTGEADEERVEEVVAEQAIETHEEAAEVFVWSGAGVAVLMALAAFLPKRQALLGVAAAGTLAVMALGVQTGHQGGELVYRHGAASAHGGAVPAGTEASPGEAGPWWRGEHEDEDDDD